MSTRLTTTREIAYDAFVEVMEHKKNPDKVIDELFNNLSKPLKRIDKNLVKEILYGSLRWYSKIFWIVQNTSDRNLDAVTPEIKAALVLGTYQIFYMDRVPDRAAVNESVEYVRHKGQANAVKFVNGILRSIARRAEYFTKPDKEKKPVDYLSLQFSHPKWIVERWSKRFNFDRLKEILAANNKVPPYTVRINAIKVPLNESLDFRSQLLKDEKNHSERQSLRSCLSLKSAPNFEAGSLFQQGFYSVQDEASQLIAPLLQPQAGETIIDACCGPGGKIGHIYELAGGEVHLIGVERSADQLNKAKENFERLGHDKPVLWVESDFCTYQPLVPIDKILLDAPCSGLGVLRRHPEGKWHKSVSLIPAMVKIQREMLTHALSILKPGGELVYSVCSFEAEETLQQLNWLQETFGDKIEVVSPVGRLPDYYKRFVTRELVLLIFSGNKDMMDGFGSFIVRKL